MRSLGHARRAVMPATTLQSSLGPDEAAAGSLASGPVAVVKSSSRARISSVVQLPTPVFAASSRLGTRRGACASMGRLRANVLAAQLPKGSLNTPSSNRVTLHTDSRCIVAHLPERLRLEHISFQPGPHLTSRTMAACRRGGMLCNRCPSGLPGSFVSPIDIVRSASTQDPE